MTDYNKMNKEPSSAATDIERRANYTELTGHTSNTLYNVLTVLTNIFQHLEGDSNTSVKDPEMKCYRDALVLNRYMAEAILNIVNQIAEVIGVG